MLEKEIERRICDHAKKRGMTAYKFNSPARAAVPDRLFIHQGVFFFMELKAEGKKPTPAQNREHARLREAGATVFVVDNVAYGKFIIDAVHLGVELGNIQSC